MKRYRREDLLCLRIWVLQTTPDREVFGVPFYRTTPRTPDRNPAHAVRPGGLSTLRRRADHRTPGASPTRRAGLLARGRLYPGADALGLPQPNYQPQRLLPRDGGSRPGLAHRTGRVAMHSQNRPVLQGPPAPA